MAKLKRKELLKKDDAFLSAASQSARWMGAHRWQVVGGSVAAVAAILVAWAAVEYVRERDAAASELYERGITILDAEVLARDSEEAPNPDGDPPTFPDENAKWQAARDQMKKVVDEAGGSGVATLARFLVADLEEKLGNTAEAEKGFTELAESLSPTDTLAYLATERAAYHKEASGDMDGALRLLNRLVNVEQGFYNDHATYHLARLYTTKGDTGRARNLLERIEEEFPDSGILDKVRERLADLPPKPEGGAESPEEAGAAESPPNPEGTAESKDADADASVADAGSGSDAEETEKEEQASP